MITFCPYPIPILVIEKGEGYILYVKDSMMFANDEFCVVLKNGGDIIHVTSQQIKMVSNKTYEINK